MSAQSPLAPILAAFTLEPAGPAHYSAPSVPDEHRPVVFGGQIMGQMIMAAAAHAPGKQVKSLHAVFARAGTVTLPVEIALDPIHAGRAFGSVSASVSQGERLLSQGLLLLDAGEGDVIRHQIPEKPTGAPLDWPATYDHGAEVRVVGAVDIMTTNVTGPPELDVWVRFPALPDDPALHQALLSWYTDPWLIATAMRPHDGVGQSQAHETLSTGVITQTLTFHETFRADQWLLIANRGLHAGCGRTYGEGHVFTESGQLVASFVQTAMVRRFREDGGVRGNAAGAM